MCRIYRILWFFASNFVLIYVFVFLNSIIHDLFYLLARLVHHLSIYFTQNANLFQNCLKILTAEAIRQNNPFKKISLQIISFKNHPCQKKSRITKIIHTGTDILFCFGFSTREYIDFVNSLRFTFHLTHSHNLVLIISLLVKSHEFLCLSENDQIYLENY